MNKCFICKNNTWLKILDLQDLKIFSALQGKPFSEKNKFKNIKIIRDYYPSQKLKNQKFDLIIFMHVLEHVFEPHLFMAAVKNNLSSSGSILLEIPNEEKTLKSGAMFYQYQHMSYFTN